MKIELLLSLLQASLVSSLPPHRHMRHHAQAPTPITTRASEQGVSLARRQLPDYEQSSMELWINYSDLESRIPLDQPTSLDVEIIARAAATTRRDIVSIVSTIEPAVTPSPEDPGVDPGILIPGYAASSNAISAASTFLDSTNTASAAGRPTSSISGQSYFPELTPSQSGTSVTLASQESADAGGGSTTTSAIIRLTTITITETRTRTAGSAGVAGGATSSQLPPNMVSSYVLSTLTSASSLLSTLTTNQVQTPSTTSSAPDTKGSIITSVSNSGALTVQPFNATVIPSPTANTISLVTTGSDRITSVASSVSPTAMATGNIFAQISLDPPPTEIKPRADHPVPRQGIVNQTGPIQTNKFYANFFLGSRTQATWTHPYSVNWLGGQSVVHSWGLAVSYVTRDAIARGPGDPAAYYINPLGIHSVIISALELSTQTQLTLDSLRSFSANVNLSPSEASGVLLTFPLVQGQAFITGVYNNGTPLLESTVFFRSLVYEGKVNNSTTERYRVTLEDSAVWFVYLTPSGQASPPVLTLQTQSRIVGDKLFTGSLQVARNPNNAASQALYDASAGTYPLRGAITGQVNNNVGTYTFNWTKGGIISRPLLLFALPHHVDSFAGGTTPNVKRELQLQTTTKGLATAVLADSWDLVETNLPVDLGFGPWQGPGAKATFSANAINLIRNTATNELSQDINAQTNLNSMYFAGKGLAKFAGIVLATNDVANATSTASAGLLKLKQAFSVFVNNTQQFPLVFDSAWGGVVSSASYNGDSGADFGNTYYNDHHFHYAYFVYTAAVIAYLDSTWLKVGHNKAWVNTLVRDFANSASNDSYFPFSRMFDWYHGHSWAHGLYEAADGKDEESTSEDTLASYALKLWGRVTGDANLEARGNLMLSIQARSLRNYFLFESNNTVAPNFFIGNKVAGITFENKQDHTTYFGTNTEYIQGIHMLPILPHSKLTRSANFVQEEWNTYFSNGRADKVDGGWRGVLYSNYALINPQAAYNFFSQPNFSNEWLDGGASRTWYLALIASWGGAS